MKEHLAQLPRLTKPVVGDILYLYFSIGKNSLSSVLIKEEGMMQKPVYYVSKVIKGARILYSKTEKAALAIMVTVRRLRPYFLSHKIIF